MKKLLFAAALACLAPIAATAQGPTAPPATTPTPPISAPATGGVVTTPATTAPTELVKRAKALAKPADRRTVLDLLKAKKFAEAEAALVAVEVATASAAADAELDAELAKAMVAEADSVQKAHDAELRKLDKAECVDWAAGGGTPAAVALRQEALRVRWRVAAFPTSLGPDGRAAWLIARGGPSGGGGGSAEVSKLRAEVKALKANTEAAVAATFAEARGLRNVVVKGGLVSEDEVVAAVDEMLRNTKFSFDAGDETSPAAPGDGARIVLKAGD